MTAGKRNLYGCDTCRKNVVTVDRDDGVAPFMMGCYATEGCPGEMHSSFYRVSGDDPATHEWYSPDAEERKTLTSGELHHVEQGGLLIRKIAT